MAQTEELKFDAPVAQGIGLRSWRTLHRAVVVEIWDHRRSELGGDTKNFSVLIGGTCAGDFEKVDHVRDFLKVELAVGTVTIPDAPE